MENDLLPYVSFEIETITIYEDKQNRANGNLREYVIDIECQLDKFLCLWKWIIFDINSVNSVSDVGNIPTYIVDELRRLYI